MGEVVKVGVANSKQINLEVDVLKTWIPKDINYISTTVLFKHDSVYYSMTRDDFKKIYNL